MGGISAELVGGSWLQLVTSKRRLAVHRCNKRGRAPGFTDTALLRGCLWDSWRSTIIPYHHEARNAEFAHISARRPAPQPTDRPDPGGDAGPSVSRGRRTRDCGWRGGTPEPEMRQNAD